VTLPTVIVTVLTRTTDGDLVTRSNDVGTGNSWKPCSRIRSSVLTTRGGACATSLGDPDHDALDRQACGPHGLGEQS
jgi:hypothetical protein